MSCPNTADAPRQEQKRRHEDRRQQGGADDLPEPGHVPKMAALPRLWSPNHFLLTGGLSSLGFFLEVVTLLQLARRVS